MTTKKLLVPLDNVLETQGLDETVQTGFSQAGSRAFDKTVKDFTKDLRKLTVQSTKGRAGTISDVNDIQEARDRLLRSNSWKSRVLETIAEALIVPGSILVGYSLPNMGTVSGYVSLAGGSLSMCIGFLLRLSK